MKPSVLFVCVKNAGKSQMAAALMRAMFGDSINVHSAGTAPKGPLNEESRASVEAVGASFAGEWAKPIDPALLDTCSRVVVIGTEATIQNPGKAPIETWEVDEPSLRGITGARRMDMIRNELIARVEELGRQLLGPAIAGR